MSDLHSFVHGTLDLSSSFLLSLIVLSAIATIAGLLLATARSVSAAGRHQLLSFSLFFPLAAAIASGTGLRNALQRLVTPPQDPPHMVVTATGDLSAIAVASEPSELLCVLTLVWAVGLLAYAIASFAMWRRWNSIARAASEVTDESLLNELRVVWNEERQIPRLALSSAATEPMVVGFVRPSILLPAHYLGRLTNDELRSVFAHETEHVRRRDNIAALLHELACAIFWFDPTKWIARRRLLDLRERACDERVLEIGCEPEPYLAALAKSCHAAIESPVVACMSGFHVRERMDSIMSYQSDRVRFLSNNLLRVVAVAAVVMFAITFAVVAPSPAFAATEDAKSYTFEVKVAPQAETRFTVDVVVFDPEGNRVMSSSAVGEGGKPLVLVSEKGATDPKQEREYRVEVDVASEGPSRATLTVSDGEKRVLHSSTKHSSWSPYSTELTTEARPISLRLQDAELHDVLKTFSQLTGMQFVADPELRGRITIDAVDLPWDAALELALGQAGLTAVRDGDVIRVLRVAPRRTAVEVPAGYKPVGDGIEPPVLMKRVEPQYSEEARAQRVAGICIVQALIDENGIVTETRVLKPLPFGLSDAAAAAVKQWVFEPATKDGVPVRVAFNVTVNFKLEKNEPVDKGAPAPDGEAANAATSLPAAETSKDPAPTSAVSETTPPVLIKRVEPRYLEAARRERTTGTVIVRALIDETGVVRETEVVRSLPNGLSQEAERAVRQWVFEPALVDGKPVAMSFDLSVDFRLGARR